MPFKILLFLPLAACLLFSFKSLRRTTRVIFFGDSITEAGVFPGGYIAQLRDSLAAQRKSGQYELIGAGIGGNKIYDLYLRLESDVLAKKPDVVVLFVGVNDVWHKRLFGTGTDPDKFQKFYEALILKLKKAGIRVVLCTPVCIGERPGSANPMDEELNFYSQIIRELARQRDCALCDFRQDFLQFEAAQNTTDLESGILTTDGVHLSEAGNRWVAERLLKIL